MKRRQSLNILVIITLFSTAWVMPATAYDLEWGLNYLADDTVGGPLCMNTSTDGKYYAVYVDETTDVLDSYIHTGGAQENVEVTDLVSPQYAYNSVDFGLNIPTLVHYDYFSDGLFASFYIAGDWGTPQELPYSNGARDVRLDMSSGIFHIAYCYEQPGSDNCYLRYISNPGGSWFMETIDLICSIGINRRFDMQVDSSGTPHFVWWDHSTQRMKHAVRNGPDDYTIENLYDDPVGCLWVELEFLFPDLPFVGFLDQDGSTRTVRLAYKIGSGWYDEELYDNVNITAIDMGVNNSGDLTTMDFFFAASLEDDIIYIQRTFSGWETKPVQGMAGYAPADRISAEWNEGTGEFGFIINSPSNNCLIFKRGAPTLPTATPASTSTPTVPPTHTPSFTPTSGPGTPTNTPFPTHTPTPECPELGVTIDMPSDMYLPGTSCYCNVRVCNPEAVTYPGTPLLVLLDVYGQYFFAPSFTDYDQYIIDVTPGSRTIEILPTFVWPSGAGSASDIWFYAGMTDPDITELFGTFDGFRFGWSS
jgi:hypothetical protein